MKRFISMFLSATVAVTLGTVANAEMYEETTESNDDFTEGVISPDSNSPYNRDVPGEGVDSNTGTMNDDAAPTEGVISPDSDSPNNRAVPGQGALDGDTDMMNNDDVAPTEGIISPDSDSPYNRAVPADDMSDGMRTFEEAYQIYQETGEFSLYNDEESASPTEGIISPDSDSPNNRVVPGEGALEDDAMMDSQDIEPTEGVISPDSDTPFNRAVPGESELDGQGEAMDTTDDSDLVDGVIVPDSNEPYNREEIR